MDRLDPPQEDVDFERLAAHLRALSHPARLEILWRLRIPHKPVDVLVRPRRQDADLPQERAMTRQSIQAHLETLEEVGVVLRTEDPEGGGAQWVTSHQHLFALIEEMRCLTAIRPAARVDVDATLSHQPATGSSWPAGPKLVLVTGPWEGQVFPLAGAGPWTIGRSRSCDVSLSYDPFVSAEHARVERAGKTFSLETAPGARNPPRLNFEPVPGRASPRMLEAGDVVGLGRSLLVFRAA